MTMATDSIRALMTDLIDYAGLFPPAKLEMDPSVENFARYINGEFSWALSHFICPVGRLDAFEKIASMLMPGTYATSGYREHVDGEAWRVSAIIDGELGACLDRIDQFNERHSHVENGLAKIDAIELKTPEPGFIDEALEEIPEDIYPFFEFPIDGDFRGYVAAIAGNEQSGGAAAKVRCGGVTPDLIPSAEDVARFIATCASASVPFKATAGLHHPIRAEHALTYEDNAPRGVMHGFVNVFLGAALIRNRKIDEGELLDLLNETDAAAFRFEDERAMWKDFAIETPALSRARTGFALSYGSCSFVEPIEDMQGLGQL